MAARKSAKRKATSPLARKGSFSHGIVVPGPTTKRKASSLQGAPTSKRRKTGESSRISKPVAAESPYAEFARPDAAEVTRLHKVLARSFGDRGRWNKKRARRQILDTVVGTILSQNTTNTNSHRAFSQLKAAFKTWDAVRVARPAAIEKSIKCAGLAPKKTPWIQKVLKTVHAERGKTSMEYLRKETKERVHSELERFPGIGKKTSAIINLFDVGHPDMAVDTHIFRYALQLGWVPTDKERTAHNKKAKRTGAKLWKVVTRDTVYAHLDARFPDKLKYSMHLILTDTVGGLPVVCGSTKKLSFSGSKVFIDGKAVAGKR
jgi:endonuclease-3